MTKLYYFLKTIIAMVYISTWIFSIKLFLIPLINLYGGWTLLGFWIALVIAGALSSTAWFILPKPRTPQATHRPEIDSTIVIPVNLESTHKDTIS